HPSPLPRSTAAPPSDPSSTAPAPDGAGSTSWLYSSANDPRTSGPIAGGLGSVSASTGRMATRVARLMKLSGMLATSGQRGIRRQYTIARLTGRRSCRAAGDATFRAARHATTLATATSTTHRHADPA